MENNNVAEIQSIAFQMESLKNSIRRNLQTLYNIKSYLDLSLVCGGMETLYDTRRLYGGTVFKNNFEKTLEQFNNNCSKYDEAYQKGRQLLSTLSEEELWVIPNDEHIISTHINQLIQQLTSEILYHH